MHLQENLILFFILEFPIAIWTSDNDTPPYGEGWLYFINDNGTNHVMNFSSVPGTENMLLGDAYFYLYTRNNNNQPEIIVVPEDNTFLEVHHFNKSNEINVITHGWLSTESVNWIQKIKNSLLRQYDLNVITVDWSELSKNIAYPFAAFCTRYVGKRIAELLNSLMVTYNITGERIHLIGHSLGAHVMGYAGMFSNDKIFRITVLICYGSKEYLAISQMKKKKKKSKRWKCITNTKKNGLDPARPLFEMPAMSPDFHLDKSDALFVDIIHTCGGVYGYRQSYGHADFYPNNGRPMQPGCSGARQVADSCSHGRSHEYFEESIEYYHKGFIAYPCDSWQKFEKGECRENSTIMGYHSSFENNGDYYLRTRNESKYAENND